ncbi:MAG TPA: GreA/GreB family elongation factor [Caldimonas sp.]|jgi:regulator of nucleoside diphosphate kinase|nr:GreA/GreB family elongation factor [Caldimonas sp.]HEX2541383.1 GreA/GreB family elongation factor [Caldimonas sp.]
MNPQSEPIVLTALDAVRLEALVRRLDDGPHADKDRPLDELLAEATVVAGHDVPKHIVTMHSCLLLRDPHGGATREVTLCYPADARPSAGWVSVLSPLGTSLLGRAEGALARWRCPGGEERVAQIAALLFQPESQGDYVT